MELHSLDCLFEYAYSSPSACTFTAILCRELDKHDQCQLIVSSLNIVYIDSASSFFVVFLINVADFADNLAEELDFRLEAQSMDAWVSHMHASPLGKNIRVPQVYWDLTSEKVLTMERIQGIRIDDVAAIRKAGFDGTELVKALLFSVFEGGLRHGLFHGDLHAGNLYVDPDGKIVFFDFGIMGRIDPRTRWLLRELVYALLVKKDHAAAGKIVVLMGAVGNVKPEAEAAKDLEKFATPLTMKSLGDMSYAEIGKQLSTLADAYDVKLPRELVLIGKQFLYVERYMKLLAPKWQMMSDPQLTGYFANFMVEVSREHKSDAGGLSRWRFARAPHDRAIWTSTTRTWATRTTRPSCSSWAWARRLLLWRKGFCERWSTRGCASSATTTATSACPARSRAAHRREAGAADGALLPRAAQPVGVHAGAHGRRRRRPARPPEIEKAHIVGASMGGMIAQVFAARYQHRTKTLAVIFSSNNQALLPPPGPSSCAPSPPGRRTPPRDGVIANAVGSAGSSAARATRRPRSRCSPTPPRATTGPTTRPACPALRRDPGQRQPAALRQARSPRRRWSSMAAPTS